jgi:hypothetical protein
MMMESFESEELAAVGSGRPSARGGVGDLCTGRIVGPFPSRKGSLPDGRDLIA